MYTATLAECQNCYIFRPHSTEYVSYSESEWGKCIWDFFLL